MLKILLLLSFFLVSEEEILKRTHEPYRLLLLDPDKTVTGIVKEVGKSIDGDVHVKLQIKELNLLVKNNFEKEDSCLILEIVCGCKSVFAICNGYMNEITIPSVGDSISVRGLFVFDKRHKINEIHPVFKN